MNSWVIGLIAFDIFLLIQIIGIIVYLFREIDMDIKQKADIIMGMKKLEFEQWVHEWGEETLKDTIREIVRDELKREMRKSR